MVGKHIVRQARFGGSAELHLMEQRVSDVLLTTNITPSCPDQIHLFLVMSFA